MRYQLTDTQSYDITALQDELIAAGLQASISGHGAKEFTVHGEDSGIDSVVQNHLQTDWAFLSEKQNKLNEINVACDAELSSITSSYPSSEVKTWDKQENEARAWNADNTVTTPFIDALITSSGDAKSDIVNRIIAKADAFISMSANTIGKRHKLEAQIDAALTIDDLKLIAW